MDVKRKVVWSKAAIKQIDLILEYLRAEWSEREAQRFLDKLSKFERVVVEFPALYPASRQRPDLRKAIIVRQVSAIYAVDGGIIRVFAVIDNRQNPDKQIIPGE